MSGALQLKDTRTGTFHLCPAGHTLLIGRHNPSAPPDIEIDDGSVSRTHCEIRPQPDGWLKVVDRSSFGTWINGQRIAGEGKAGVGDRIVVGSQFAFDVVEARYPARFGERYRVLREIAEGSMGIVLEGIDEQGSRCAIKLLKKTRARQDQVKRFKREIELGHQLSGHPGIVAMLDSGALPSGELYCVMDYVAGRPFNEAITQGMSLEAGVGIVAAVARAVAYAHEQGVIHRDLKPQNVIVTPGGEARLTDFGVAKALDDVDGLTRTGAVMGTVTYMAPEQVEDSKRVDERSDVYGLGSILYAALTRRTPLDLRGLNMRQSLKKVLEHDVKPPSTWAPEVDPVMDGICMRALARRPADRYQTAAELAAALEAWSSGERSPGGEAAPPSAPARAARQLAARDVDEDETEYPAGLVLLVMLALGVAIAVAIYVAAR